MTSKSALAFAEMTVLLLSQLAYREFWAPAKHVVQQGSDKEARHAGYMIFFENSSPQNTKGGAYPAKTL